MKAEEILARASTSLEGEMLTPTDQPGTLHVNYYDIYRMLNDAVAQLQGPPKTLCEQLLRNLQANHDLNIAVRK